MSSVKHSAGNLVRFSNNAALDEIEEELELEFEPVCPQNGWSMNEIWKYAYISPPPGYYIMEDSGPFRASYDYGEPAGLPSERDPHSTLPGDWGYTEDGEPVTYLPQREGGSKVRKDTETKKGQ